MDEGRLIYDGENAQKEKRVTIADTRLQKSRTEVSGILPPDETSPPKKKSGVAIA